MYEVLWRKFEPDNEGWLVSKLKNKIKERNENDWGEKICMKSILK